MYSEFESLVLSANKDRPNLIYEIESMVHSIEPSKILELAVTCKKVHNYYLSALWLVVLTNKHHNYSVKETIAIICNEPYMLENMIIILETVRGTRKLPSAIRQGLAKAFDNFSSKSLLTHNKTLIGYSIADIANLVHPIPTPRNKRALAMLMR